MCYKRNIEIPSRFIPTEIVDIFKARESIYNFGNFESLHPSNNLL